MNKLESAVHRRKCLNLNTIFEVVGARGSGKSYLSMKLAEAFDPSFCVDDVVFDVESFLERLKVVQGKWKCLLFDEAGLEGAMPSRLFMRSLNLIMSYVAESFRVTRTHLFVTVPNQSMIDLSMRLLSDFQIIMKARGKARCYIIKMDHFRAGHIITPILCDVETKMPSQKLCDDYEAKRKIWMDNYYTKWLGDIKMENQDAGRKHRDLEAEGKEILEEIEAESIPKHKIAYELATRLNISLAQAYKLKYALKVE